MKIAKERPDLFDVAFTNFDEEIMKFHSAADGEALRNRFPRSKAVTFADTMPKYKFVLNVAAVLSSWRVPQLLSSGALVFLQENSDMDLIHAWMTPWVHFVPVRNDLSDLVQKVDYMIAHDGEAQRIANAGYMFFKANVTRASTACYIWRPIRSIADHSDLQKREVDQFANGKRWTEITTTNEILTQLMSIGRSEL